MSRILMTLLALGCGNSKTDSLTAAFETEGFTVLSGSVTDFQIEDCERLERCFGNNASAPYVLFNLPSLNQDPALLPENAVGQIPRVPETQRSQYFLEANEAIVIAGLTPPDSKYFGFTPYLFSRVSETGERISVFASLTDTLNHTNIQTDDAPFNSTTAIIYASDDAAMSAAKSALLNQGYKDSAINEVILPRTGMRYGNDPTSSDSFLIMGRVALVDDPTLGKSYLENLPLEVYRLTPELEGSALPVAERLARGNGETEDHLQTGLEELEAAILADAEETGEVRAITVASSALVANLINPESCILNVTECKGDNSDTTYAAGPLSVIQAQGQNTLAEDEHFIVYGVNHTAAGKSTYSNFSVYTQSKRIGVVAVDNSSMPGSADAYLPNHPDKDQFFAYEVRRDCADRDHCLTLGTDFPGAALDENLFFIFRAYLNPGMSISPAHDEILTERVIHVSPR